VPDAQDLHAIPQERDRTGRNHRIGCRSGASREKDRHAPETVLAFRRPCATMEAEGPAGLGPAQPRNRPVGDVAQRQIIHNAQDRQNR
jgi:hypothetical protein